MMAMWLNISRRAKCTSGRLQKAHQIRQCGIPLQLNLAILVRAKGHQFKKNLMAHWALLTKIQSKRVIIAFDKWHTFLIC